MTSNKELKELKTDEHGLWDLMLSKLDDDSDGVELTGFNVDIVNVDKEHDYDDSIIVNVDMVE